MRRKKKNDNKKYPSPGRLLELLIVGVVPFIRLTKGNQKKKKIIQFLDSFL